MQTSSGHANHRPRHVGSQVFAPHRAFGGALNSWAILRGHTPPRSPHVRRVGRHADCGSQSSNAASGQRCLFDDVGVCFAHESECATLTNEMQVSGTITGVTSLADRLKMVRERLGLSQADLADQVGISPGAIGNLEAGTRKTSRSLLQISRALGVRPQWLQFGELPESVQSQVGIIPVAHPVILDEITVVPTIQWETLKMTTAELPDVFKLAAPDASMAPKVPQGTMVEFTRSLSPRPGDGVLVKDREGHFYLRIYREKRPGHWEAYAINEAYSPLDSQADGLAVVAVLTAVAGRWA
jgi:transcriptional regulator with XRE-family HTH domain